LSKQLPAWSRSPVTFLQLGLERLFSRTPVVSLTFEVRHLPDGLVTLREILPLRLGAPYHSREGIFLTGCGQLGQDRFREGETSVADE
jgi:hypothetical protein